MGGASKKINFHQKTNSAVSFNTPNAVIEDDESNEITRDEIANIEDDFNNESSIAHYESA